MSLLNLSKEIYKWKEIVWKLEKIEYGRFIEYSIYIWDDIYANLLLEEPFEDDENKWFSLIRDWEHRLACILTILESWEISIRKAPRIPQHLSLWNDSE